MPSWSPVTAWTRTMAYNFHTRAAEVAMIASPVWRVSKAVGIRRPA